MTKYQIALRCLLTFNGNGFAENLLCNREELRSVLFIGLELSAAFDIIDHHFSFEILAKMIGFQSVVLLFTENCLSDRSKTSYYKRMSFW